MHTVIYMKAKRESTLTKQLRLSLKNPRMFCLGRFIHSVIKTLCKYDILQKLQTTATTSCSEGLFPLVNILLWIVHCALFWRPLEFFLYLFWCWVFTIWLQMLLKFKFPLPVLCPHLLSMYLQLLLYYESNEGLKYHLKHPNRCAIKTTTSFTLCNKYARQIVCVYARLAALDSKIWT